MELFETLGTHEWILIGFVAFVLVVGFVLRLSSAKKLSARDVISEVSSDATVSAETSAALAKSASSVAPATVATPEVRTLEKALATTRLGLFGRLKTLLGVDQALDENVREQLEEILYTSDLGPTTVEYLMSVIAEKFPQKLNFESVRVALRDQISQIMNPVQDSSDSKGLDGLDAHFIDGPKPRIWMIVGVNGAGKTTTIGKLSSLMAQKDLKVLVAAGDTFRAAAGGQLKVWSERAAVEILGGEGNAKPSGIAFDACQKAVKEKFDLVLLDTAGRLHTQLNLMEELKKIKRVIEKSIPGAPHQVLLVLDANSGQNALVQAREFHEALGVTGVILTKLDGTAKGGVVVGLAHELHIPVKAVGIGEKLEDLKAFSTREFVDSIL